MRQLWSCFMFLMWTQSLEDRRRALWKAEAFQEATDPLSPEWESVDAARLRKEARVNRALVKRNKWRKRACENCRSRVQRSQT